MSQEKIQNKQTKRKKLFFLVDNYVNYEKKKPQAIVC